IKHFVSRRALDIEGLGEKLVDQLQAFRARREHFAMVVDEYGSLLGIVTLNFFSPMSCTLSLHFPEAPSPLSLC
ncbi:MAG TPA: hypothetical protein EYP34_08105, partial [Chromatiaceae bacterium]|nr:hypothetical protein [Chromatiaceae bacterium]